jgi:pyridoxal phosphate enzyme (YggS family)
MALIGSIAENLANVRARIAAAAVAAGRDPAAITLVAVSKTYPVADILAARDAGAAVFGENRVQEAAAKFPIAGARLHIIGPLQTNKVAQALALADAIDTLDREKLFAPIAKAAAQTGRMPDLLVQINIGDEPQKAGVSTAAADHFIRAARAQFGPAVTGVMAIPPAGADPAPYFRHVVALADIHGLAVRSIGMSGDFETAIACGATHVRIGAAIFGVRPAVAKIS